MNQEDFSDPPSKKKPFEPAITYGKIKRKKEAPERFRPWADYAMAGFWVVLLSSLCVSLIWWQNRGKSAMEMKRLLKLKEQKMCGALRNANQHALKVLLMVPGSARRSLSDDLDDHLRPVHQGWAKYFAALLRKKVAHLGADRVTFGVSQWSIMDNKPEVYRRRALYYGQFCRAELLIAIKMAIPQDGAGSSNASLSVFLSPLFSRIAVQFWPHARLGLAKQEWVLGGVKSLEEKWTSGKTIPADSSVFRMLKGLAALKAANDVKDSQHVALTLHKEASKELGHLQIQGIRTYKKDVVQRTGKLSKLKKHENYIPSGAFWMGPYTKREQKEEGLKAKLVQEEAGDFFIDTYEASRERYALCVLDRKCPAIEYQFQMPMSWPRDRVNLEQAQAYCQSHGQTLPTEEQWVKAARGAISFAEKANPFPKRLYPWGAEKPKCSLANTRWCYTRKDKGQQIPIMLGVANPLGGKSPYGVAHMLGNAAEMLDNGKIKGGSGFSATRTIAWKDQMDQRKGLSWIGFRCVRKAPTSRKAPFPVK